jgi:DNA adenine methylase
MMGAGMMSFFSRLGGKHYLKKDIYRLFPPDDTYSTYVEAFAGGASLFFEKDPSPREVLNDLDKDIYYAFKDIKSVTEDQIKKMNFTPNKKWFDELKAMKRPTNACDRLYRFLYLKYFSFSSMGQSFSPQREYTRKKTLLRRLPALQERLRHVTILNWDYKRVLRKYDSPSTLFYLDPPYLDVNTSEYKHKTIDIDELASILKDLKGRFILSYNDHSFIRKTFAGFHIKSITASYYIGGSGPRPSKELLISNFKLVQKKEK